MEQAKNEVVSRVIQATEEGDFITFELKDLENTIVAEITTLMFSGQELKYDGSLETDKGSEIIGELNLFEKACHVLWMKYEKLNSMLKLSMGGRKNLEEIEDEESFCGFLNRAEIAKDMLFDSIFRRYPPEIGKFYYVGYNFKIMRMDLPEEENSDLCQCRTCGKDDDVELLMLFSATDAKKIGNA